MGTLRKRQASILAVVLAINAAMFVVELVAGLLAGSTALLADSLDMLGDSFVYGFSLYVLERSELWRARAALSKGAIMLAFGLGVLFEAALKLQSGAVPSATGMAGIGAVALLANAFCFGLLWRHRSDDLNLRSTWLCSRNDLIANLAVLGAAGLVARLGALWPDVVVGVGIALLFLRTAASVLQDSWIEIVRARGASPAQ
jgi:cation diffusion facilitator family transporter